MSHSESSRRVNSVLYSEAIKSDNDPVQQLDVPATTSACHLILY